MTYTGPKEQGEPFEASLFGWDGEPPAKPSDRKRPDLLECISESAESRQVRVNEMAILPIAIASPALFVDRFMIANAEDWIVHDIRTHGRSIFVSGGDLPGQMFTGSVPVILKPLAARDLVEIAATYVGKSATASLMVELSGTTKPTDYEARHQLLLTAVNGRQIVPTQSAQIACPSGKAFLPERLVITDPDAWIINDIKVGNRCQTAQSGDFPGQCFSIRAVGCDVTFNYVYPEGVTLKSSRRAKRTARRTRLSTLEFRDISLNRRDHHRAQR